MARYREAVCRLCRREGQKLFLKGQRCFTEKCAIEKRNLFPGSTARPPRPRVVGYGLQLREKQKVRRIYGLLERQFRNYFEKAATREGHHGREPACDMLERRLDNVVYRAGPRRPRARRPGNWCCHGHIRVNGQKVNIPSYLVSVGRGDCAQGEDAPERHGARSAQTSRRARAPCPGWKWTARTSRPGGGAAEARRRADSADQRAADRRTVLEVTTGLRGTLASIVRMGSGCSAGRKEAHDVEGFSEAKALGGRTDTLTDKYGQFSAQPFERGSARPSATRCGACCSAPSKARPSPR